jgi:hypothetical protein
VTANLERLRAWQEAERQMVEKIKTTPLEDWSKHPDIMARVEKQGFDIEAAIKRRDERGNGPDSALDVTDPK